MRPGIKPGSPAVMARVLSTELPDKFGNSVELVYTPDHEYWVLMGVMWPCVYLFSTLDEGKAMPAVLLEAIPALYHCSALPGLVMVTLQYLDTSTVLISPPEQLGSTTTFNKKYSTSTSTVLQYLDTCIVLYYLDTSTVLNFLGTSKVSKHRYRTAQSRHKYVSASSSHWSRTAASRHIIYIPVQYFTI